MSKVVVVTGASSGIGLAIAQNFENLGYTVYSFSRNAPSDESIHFMPCDVSDFESVEHAFSSLIDGFTPDGFLQNFYKKDQGL